MTSSGLSVRADLLRPVARWQSPDFFLKRYDIAYFTTALPVGQDPKLLLGKGVWGDWLNVRELLEAKDTSELGDRIGQPNTVGRTLDQLIHPGVCACSNPWQRPRLPWPGCPNAAILR